MSRNSRAEINAWLADKLKAPEPDTPPAEAPPKPHEAECVHCGCYFGVGQGHIGKEVSLCDTCLG